MLFHDLTISLAADGVGVSNLQDCSENDIGKIKLPDYWWRALDVSTNELSSTVENINNLIHKRGDTPIS